MKLDEWLPRAGINLPGAKNEGQQGGRQISNGCATKTQQGKENLICLGWIRRNEGSGCVPLLF